MINISNLTLKERERIAYLEGNLEVAKLLGELKDAVDDLAYSEQYKEEYDYE